MEGILYLHNLAGQALAAANARIAELEAQVERLTHEKPEPADR